MSKLRPPLRVALARSVDDLPRGPFAYEPKFDGHRVLIFRTGDGPLLQARSGRLVGEAFPDLVAAARALPDGTVLDGEVVVWTEGRIDFAAVQKRAMATASRAAVLAGRLPASYAAFDLLAVGEEDLRAQPYERRRSRLVELLSPLGPPLQPVPMTTDPEEAGTWYETLPRIGVEGLVVKQLSLPYRGGRRDWRKLRHADTRDAVVVGVTGSPRHPRALALVFPDDDTPVVSRPLAPGLRLQLAEALARLREPGTEGPDTTEAGSDGPDTTEAGSDGPDTTEAGSETGEAGDGTTFRRVPGELTVEVRRTTTRQPLVEVVRVRESG